MRTKRKSKRKQRHVWRWAIGVLVLAVLVTAGWAYWYLEPGRHFETSDLPILAQPHTPQTDEGAGKDGSEKETVPTTTPDSSTSTPASSTKPQTSFNVLILGLDSAQQAISRTDVIMLAHVNPQAGTVSLVSVPRDTRVHLPGIGWTKINHAHVVGELNGGEQAGTQATVQAVSDLFQVPIHYYVKTDFTGFQGMIDEVGGIDVHLKQAVVLTDQHRTIPAGDQHLDGEMALKLARERYSLPDGDLGRQRHQSLILKALIHKALQPRQLQHVPQLISALHEDVLDTNLQDSDLISLAWLYRDLTDEQIHYQSLPGHSLYAQDPLVKAELYYWAADPQAVIEIAQEEFEQKGPPK